MSENLLQSLPPIRLAQLQYLCLNNNRIYEMPAIGTLVELQQLYVNNNSLQGNIHIELPRLQLLEL